VSHMRTWFRTVGLVAAVVCTPLMFGVFPFLWTRV
jgi:hypothetical protein